MSCKAVWPDACSVQSPKEHIGAIEPSKPRIPFRYRLHGFETSARAFNMKAVCLDVGPRSGDRLRNGPAVVHQVHGSMNHSRRYSA